MKKTEAEMTADVGWKTLWKATLEWWVVGNRRQVMNEPNTFVFRATENHAQAAGVADRLIAFRQKVATRTAIATIERIGKLEN